MNRFYIIMFIDCFYLVNFIIVYSWYGFQKEQNLNEFINQQFYKRLMSKQNQADIDFLKENQSENDQVQQYKNNHVKSHLLPKIHKTTAIAKAKYNDHQITIPTKIVINQSDEQFKRQQMAVIINDYLQNFRSKQKGYMLAFTTQKNKIQQKPIMVQGVSHERFVGLQSIIQRKKSYSIDMKAKLRTKGNCTILQKLKSQCKIDMKKSNYRFNTQPDKKNDANYNLKGYVLKAKKSLIDCRQKSQQKQIRGKKTVKIEPWETQF